MTKILNVVFPQIRKNNLYDVEDGVIFTPNVDHLVKLQCDRDFYDAYKHADLVICDSRILFFSSKLLKQPIVETISGSSLFHDYCCYFRSDSSKKIFILGGKEGVALKAQERINSSLNSSIVVGAHSPSFHIDDEESCDIAEIINNSGANIVVVALGAPQQEKWIVRYKHLMPNVKLWMALGATVDFEAGTLKRAPVLWQKVGLEWFYRFLQEPRRLFKRYFIDDMKFFWYFGKQLLGVYRNPFE